VDAGEIAIHQARMVGSIMRRARRGDRRVPEQLDLSVERQAIDTEICSSMPSSPSTRIFRSRAELHQLLSSVTSR